MRWLPTVDGMRNAVTATALGLTLATAALTSCSTRQEPMPPPEPAPTVTPVFASEEEALAAAEELYGRYLKIANRIGHGGWKDTSGYADVARGEALEDELASATEYSAKKLKQRGDFTFDSMTLQQLRNNGQSGVEIVVYVCLDVSKVDVVDPSGHSAVSPERLNRQPLELQIDDADGQYKVNRSEAWSGADFC
jgi:hypothetical protein